MKERELLKKITKITLSAEQLYGVPNPKIIVTGLRDRCKYVDGKKTDEITDKIIDGVIPECEYDKVSVKIPLDKNTLTEEQIKQKVVQVRCKNLIGRYYWSDGEYKLSASADSVEVIA